MLTEGDIAAARHNAALGQRAGEELPQLLAGDVARLLDERERLWYGLHWIAAARQLLEGNKAQRQCIALDLLDKQLRLLDALLAGGDFRQPGELDRITGETP